MNFNNFPPELNELPQWVMWKLEYRPEQAKPSKIPYTVDNIRASATDSDTWNMFDNCIEALETGLYHGIGFVFSEDDDYIGVDWDNVRDPETGDIDPEVIQEIRDLDSYAEISQSGTGLHVITVGKKPGERCRSGCREMYDKERFFVMTGNHLENTPFEIKPASSEVLKSIYHKIAPDEKEKMETSKPVGGRKVSPPLTDEEIFSLCMGAKNANKFEELWDGSTSGHENDDSRADLALCTILAFYTQNSAQIDRLFRKSKLYRSKWERSDYRGRTIQTSIGGLTEVYNPCMQNQDGAGGCVLFGEKGKFLPSELAKALMKEMNIVTFNDDRASVYWNGRYYQEGADNLIMARAQELLGKDSTKHRVAETLFYIKNDTLEERSVFDKQTGEINLQNGVYNIYSRDFRAHSHEDRFTYVLPFPYDRNATCPQFDTFLNEVLEPEYIATAYEWIAYGFVPGYPIQKFLYLHGDGGNGKGVYLQVNTAMYGSKNVSSLSMQDIENDRYSKAELFGKLMNVCGDMSNQQLKDTSTVKSLTGGDEVTARKIYGKPFKFINRSKMVFSMNYIPESLDNSDSWYRRFLLIPFKRRVVGNECTELDYYKKLTTPEELSGIFNRCMEVLPALLERGDFSCSMGIRKTRTYTQERSNPIAAFADECGHLSEDNEVPIDEVYAANIRYCRLNNITVIDRRVFGKKFRGLYKGEIISTRPYVNKVRLTCYKGYELKNGWHGLNAEQEIEAYENSRENGHIKRGGGQDPVIKKKSVFPDTDDTIEHSGHNKSLIINNPRQDSSNCVSSGIVEKIVQNDMTNVINEKNEGIDYDNENKSLCPSYDQEDSVVTKYRTCQECGEKKWGFVAIHDNTGCKHICILCYSRLWKERQAKNSNNKDIRG
ncbi:phage/plasmid primase, P4 family [Methanolobus sp. ZRKC5]|uniref:phage/plasmid primase, P4 family n=1 Tax=unclassified Methanolobus TaxID=2629569 RepID=UPI00313B0BBC